MKYISEGGIIIFQDDSLDTPAKVMARKRELLWELRKRKNKKRKQGKIILDILEKEVATFPKEEFVDQERADIERFVILKPCETAFTKNGPPAPSHNA